MVHGITDFSFWYQMKEVGDARRERQALERAPDREMEGKALGSKILEAYGILRYLPYSEYSGHNRYSCLAFDCSYLMERIANFWRLKSKKHIPCKFVNQISAT